MFGKACSASLTLSYVSLTRHRGFNEMNRRAQRDVTVNALMNAYTESYWCAHDATHCVTSRCALD